MTQPSAAIADRETALLAPFAMHSVESRGRAHDEPPHPYRGPFQRDRDRILHCSAFRRLAHKTQVFTGEMGDYHRTRLTHTLEVASIARTIGRALRLNEDLIEALALLHDIGHPPFGHAGEDVLDECLADCGGFNHNRQAVRIVERLETRYPVFRGLNLTSEVLNGQTSRYMKPAVGRLLEVQVVDAADSIAYDAHDADDAVELGLLAADDLNETEMWRTAGRAARDKYAALNDDEFRRATVHSMIDSLTSDIIESTMLRLSGQGYSSAKEVIASGEQLVRPSDDTATLKSHLEAFLFERVYRHPDLLLKREEAGAVLRTLFEAMVGESAGVPAEFGVLAETDGSRRAAADYLAGMTDRFAWDAHRKLSGLSGGRIGAGGAGC